MILSNIVTHLSSHFTWTGNSGCAEASDFNGSLLVEQVYDDAADIGFRVKSAKTGALLLFTHYQTKRDSENEVIADIFCTNDRKFEIHILND